MEHPPAAELRKLPQVDSVVEAMLHGEARLLATDSARRAVDESREAVMGGRPAPSFDDIVARAEAIMASDLRPALRRVINATGVILHTNLGRAPLSEAALRAMESAGAGYSNLEFDLGTGKRGSRYAHARGLIARLTGAEAALVVNNNAAAVLLCLASAARGREVIVSRGELIEIGGEFRIPDILAQSGAVLREVGTTNRTHLKDYRRALGPQTAAIMKIHPSNYRVVGFTAEVAAADLTALAREAGVLLINDVGSGLLRRSIGGMRPGWLAGEPAVDEALAEGADLVTFSGDKLLGGPQAGLIAGRAEAVERLHSSPLLRAFRVDKTTLAALEQTLLAYLRGEEAQLPIWQMALTGPGEIEERQLQLAASLEGAAGKFEVLPGFSTTGGGSAPGAQIPSWVLEIAPGGRAPAEVMRSLLDGDPPVVARVENDRVVVDLRTVLPGQQAALASALRAAL